MILQLVCQGQIYRVRQKKKNGPIIIHLWLLKCGHFISFSSELWLGVYMVIRVEQLHSCRCVSLTLMFSYPVLYPIYTHLLGRVEKKL